jgi:hypothetical protein
MFEVWSGNLSGYFVSTGQNVFLPFPTGVDFITVYNETVAYAAGTGAGAQYFWRAGMPAGQGIVYNKTNAGTTLNIGEIAANGGFFYQDSSITTAGPITALTAININGGAGLNGGVPQVTTGNTNGLPTVAAVGGNSVPVGIIRIYSTVNAQQLSAIDFSVANVVNNVSMDLIYMKQLALAGIAGTYAVIPFNPYIYPNDRFIADIIANPANSNQAIITLTVQHTFQIGQKVRLVIPQVTGLAYGQMSTLNGKAVTIVNVGAADYLGQTNTITVDVSVSGLGAFTWPLTTGPGFTAAQVIPFGENTGIANTNPYGIGTVFPAPPSIATPAPAYPYGDSVMNIAQKGLLLVAGANSPAGVATNVVSWVAGKSWNR